MLKIAVLAPIPSASVIIATAENAGFLISPRKASRRLLITQYDHGIDARGAARRNKAGSGSDRSQQCRDCKINGRIERVDFEKNNFDSSRRDDPQEQCDPSGAKNKADHELPRSLSHDHAKNPLRVRAQRHANSKFLGALVHRKTHHSIEADRRENECDRSKDGKQTRDHTASGKNLGVQSGGCSREISRQVRVELGDRLAQCWSESLRALPRTRTNEDGAKLRRRRCAEQRRVKSGRFSLLIERSLHQRVRHHADDRAPRLRFAGIENSNLMAERALIAPIFSDKARVYDRDRLFRVRVINCKIAAFQNLETERGKIIVRDRFEIPARSIAVSQIILPVYLVLSRRCKSHPEAVAHRSGFELGIRP